MAGTGGWTGSREGEEVVGVRRCPAATLSSVHVGAGGWKGHKELQAVGVGTVAVADAAGAAHGA